MPHVYCAVPLHRTMWEHSQYKKICQLDKSQSHNFRVITISKKQLVRTNHHWMLTESMNEWQLFQHSILWSADYIFGRVQGPRQIALHHSWSDFNFILAQKFTFIHLSLAKINFILLSGNCIGIPETINQYFYLYWYLLYIHVTTFLLQYSVCTARMLW